MPDELRQFNYDTISDVIIHISYTAKDGGETFRNTVNAVLKDLINKMFTITASTKPGLFKLFSLRHNFPNDFYKMLAGTGTEYKIKIGSSSFPYFTKNRSINLIDTPFLFDASGNPITSNIIKSTNVPNETIGEDWKLLITYSPVELQAISDVLVLIRYSI